jgi:hypothetical protein
LADVIRWFKRRDSGPVQLFFLVTFLGALLIVALFSELTGVAASFASPIHWSAFSHVVAIVQYWYRPLSSAKSPPE